MSKTDTKQKIDYRHLARWFFTSGAYGFRLKLFLLVFLTVGTALSEGVGLLLILPVLQTMLPNSPQSDGLNEPEILTKSIEFLRWILPENLEFVLRQENLLITLLSLMLFIVTAKTILRLTANWQTARSQWGLMSSWSILMLEKYLKDDYLSFLNNKHGEMLGNVMNETRVAAIGVWHGILLFSETILFTAYIVVLVIANWQITILQLGVVFFIGIAVWGFIHGLSTRTGVFGLNAYLKAEATASEGLAALRQIKASAIETEVVEKFRRPIDEFARLKIKQQVDSSIPNSVSEVLVLFLVLVAVYYFYNFSDVQLQSQFPTLALLALIANRLFVSLAKMASIYMTFTASLPSMEIVAKLLEPKQHVNSIVPDRGPVDLSKVIVFSDVFFQYPGKSKKVLRGLDLTIRGGKVTALVGSSGGGKSTTIDLLLGFIQPTKGTLLVNGKDHSRLDYQSLRKSIAYVSQEVYMFNASIRENLLIHNPEATNAQIKDACERANIAKFIDSLPENYETRIGDRGVMLSGGERQRLAIAIAFLRDSELIIFDEPTNALDPETELAVHQAVRSLKNKTIFFVTHRISSALRPDNLFELRNGKVNEIDASAAAV